MNKTKIRAFLSFSLSIVALTAIALITTTEKTIAQDTAVTEKLTNYVVDNFEMANTWEGLMPREQGLIKIKRTLGGYAIPRDEASNFNRYILGVKIQYFKSGYSWFSLKPPRMIRIPGLVKQISVQVAGRNYQHELSFVIRDFNGFQHTLPVGKLNFVGWKKLSMLVPASIPQNEYHRYEAGIYFCGLRINCNPKETHGQYYAYFDDLMAETDLYTLLYKDPEDPKDDW